MEQMQAYRELFIQHELAYYADIFNKAIWGDMGDDTASISIQATDSCWKLSFIRTQSGEPSAYSGFVCQVIDEYEKQFNDQEMHDYLIFHNLWQDFTIFMQNKKTL